MPNGRTVRSKSIPVDKPTRNLPCHTTNRLAPVLLDNPSLFVPGDKPGLLRPIRQALSDQATNQSIPGRLPVPTPSIDKSFRSQASDYPFQPRSIDVPILGNPR